jgi:hypothetical protein
MNLTKLYWYFGALGEDISLTGGICMRKKIGLERDE